MDESLTMQRRMEQQQRQEEVRQYRPEQDVTAHIQDFYELDGMQEEAEKVRRDYAEDQRRGFLLSHFRALQPTDTAASPQAHRPAMENKKERKAYYSEQKKKARKNEGGLLSEEEVAKLEVLRQSSWGRKTWMREVKKGSDYTQDELYQQALGGDFKDFEHLDEPLRNALASRWMRENFTMPAPGQTPGEYARHLAELRGAEGLMHPLFRLGVSLAMRSGFNGIPKEFFVELDNKCCSEIMVMTLTKQVDLEEKEAMVREHPEKDKEKARASVEADILRSQASQIFMAKNLLLMHMSKFSLKQKGKPDMDWPYDVSSAFGHCSRVSFILPPLGDTSPEEAQKHRTMWSALREVRKSSADDMEGNACGIFRRGASTHDFQRRRVVRRDGGGEFKEKKKLANFSGQEGLNVAIGGLYNEGVNKRRLLSDGSCGHIYTMKKEAAMDKYGGFLLGFESDAYKKTNQLGHKHGFGNGEFASSFGGQRVDEVGDKYGGRVCDLGHIPPDAITVRMLQLERYMRRAMSEGADMTPVMRILAGKQMDGQELSSFFRTIDRLTTELESRNTERYAGDVGVFR